MKREVTTRNLLAVLVDEDANHIRGIYDDGANDGILVITDNESFWERITSEDKK